ncbi:sensor histidine kinase [Paenibacillus physcomitrellae]|uniref:histidine kinase n=1 Tax=Paenibacillus physcomitrellae TaxID=1619311 RepID=A0ABQ1FNW0_9BACL|nr:histidine kinase [Paenibacillus physcomitrellae]GGA23959.1 two-component sensor histidine kinase [Paenibacillus physcomitrellae]
MNSHKMMLEGWVIGSKLVLLGYVIWESYFRQNQTGGWAVFAYLVYICLVFAERVLKDRGARLVTALFTAAFLTLSSWLLEIPLLLLLPLSLIELGETFKPRGLSLLLLIAGAWLVPNRELPLYAAAAAISWLGYLIIREGGEKLVRQNSRNEELGADLQRLTRALSENREYARQSEYTIKLEERNRLSQRIHDEIGHSMAGALIQMEASKRLLTVNPEKAAELLGNAIHISKEGLEQIRLTLKDTKPRSEELGINRLRLFVDELAAKHSLSASLTYEGDLDVITPLQWKVIQDNAKEAVTNTIKYAEADKVQLHIQVLNRLVKSQISDNGIGAGQIVKGLGITGMEERTASLGGTLIVDGSDGFRVITLLPLEGKDSREFTHDGRS